MASKTGLLKHLKEGNVEALLAGLDESPELVPFKEERGRNWLHLCASVSERAFATPSMRLAEGLLARGLDINAAAFTEGTWHATPLWYAVARGRNIELASYLLEYGSTPEHCLWAASFNEDLDMLDLLIEYGATLEAVAEAETPLLGAVKWSKFKAASFLLSAGADPNYQDAKRMTALHYMLKKNSDFKHFNMFVTNGAKGDISNAEGQTAREIMRRKRDKRFHDLARRFVS